MNELAKRPLPAPDFTKPELAPPTLLSTDGETLLHRFNLVGVVYARNRMGAQVMVDACDMMLDGLRIESPAQTRMFGRKEEVVELPAPDEG